MTIPRQHLEERAKVRPAGYLADVAAAGRWTEDGTALLLDEAAWQRLCAKYQGGHRGMRGLGDLIEAAARWCGAAALVHWLERRVGFKCGCERRRDALNRRFPFRSRT